MFLRIFSLSARVIILEQHIHLLTMGQRCDNMLELEIHQAHAVFQIIPQLCIPINHISSLPNTHHDIFSKFRLHHPGLLKHGAIIKCTYINNTRITAQTMNMPNNSHNGLAVFRRSTLRW